MIDFCSLYSGSSGNCILVGDGNNHLLIDVGMSGKKIEEALNNNNLSTKDISAILITHEHSDHIKGIGVIARRYGIPIYLTQGTKAAIDSYECYGKIDESLYNIISADTEFDVFGMRVKPIRISHDVNEPVAYRIYNGDRSVAVMTDLGVYDEYIVDSIKGVDGVLLESNHDVKMLQAGPYSYPLKMRILSDKGHLSNENSGKLLSKILHDEMQFVMLGHLSAENNYPDLAYETVRSEIDLADNKYRSIDFSIEVAARDHSSRFIELR